MSHRAEVMAPAGSWESLRAAINAGADSIYFGMEALNMRSHAAYNFTLDDLPKVVRICHTHNVLAYVTLNSLIYNEDLETMRALCQAAKQARADAIIASDIAVIHYASSLGIPVHISTQLNVGNSEAVRFFSRYADVVVLARELTLEQIREIHRTIVNESIRGPSGELVRIELFVHGAMCVSISGKCYMSLMGYNESANRGRCTQVCRRQYRVIDEQTQEELVLDNRYVMSPRDLCTVSFLKPLIEAGVSVLKIEGRGRAPDYVHTVVGVYKEARDAIYEGTVTEERCQQWKERLATTYNRGFWEGGYYLGKRLGEWSASGGSLATQKKTYVGKVTHYFSRLQVAEVLVEAESVAVGDSILVLGPTTGVIEHTITSLHAQGPIERAHQGMRVAFPVPSRVRKNDKLYLVQERG